MNKIIERAALAMMDVDLVPINASPQNDALPRLDIVEHYQRLARAALESLCILPEALKDPYWPLSHVAGATEANPIPSMQAAIDAFVKEALK